MRPIHWFTAIVVCLMLLPSTGYTADTNITVVRVTPALDLDQMQFILSHERKDVFERGMPLASNQLDAFWDVFDEYAKIGSSWMPNDCGCWGCSTAKTRG